MSILARTTIGVIGSGTNEHDDLARDVGALIAALGANLLTGGGGGVMTSVSRAYCAAPRSAGICIGVIPCLSETDRATPKPGYPNRYVELPIRTHLPFSGKLGTHDLSRNHINILSCAAIVALPGEDGTKAEIELAVRYGRPILIYAADATAVAHFPPQVPRIHALPDLEKFLTHYTDASCRD